ncbi:MAG: hypothetical protein ACI97A_002872 [Planctomycetota bacterium]|jgi:hypothetical protein
MDRSFLSDQAVVKASRGFVCARLATYEDKEEAVFLKSVFRGRTGELENSVFGIFDPTGKKRLVRTGRSPSFAFDDAAEMASEMQKISKKYPGKKQVKVSARQMPYLKNLRLALNVTASDAQQLLIVHAADKKQLASMEAKLKQLIWKDKLVGRFLYVSVVGEGKDLLKGITKALKKSGSFMVVKPGEFGLTGEVIDSVSATAKVDKIEKQLLVIAKKHKGLSKDSRQSIRKGRKSGAKWETEVPVTDPHDGGRRRRSKNG